MHNYQNTNYQGSSCTSNQLISIVNDQIILFVFKHLCKTS